MGSIFKKNKQQYVDYSELPDNELIHYYRSSGSTEPVGYLFTRYSHLVYGVCLKYLKNESDAQDAVMDIFEKLMEDLKNHEVKNFKSWLYSVSKNFCLMELRKVKPVSRVNDHSLEKFSEEFMDSELVLHLDNKYQTDDKIEKVQQAIKQLNHEQKWCIELLYLHQKSYKEVSDITGYSMKQVKSYIQNGKRNLKNILMTK
jgi:RNA polymerase sigma-70 factor (ECF subfamily)